jgi:hypothetical protein
MIRSALEFLIGLGEAKIQEIKGGTYTDKKLTRVFEQTADDLKTTTLTALVDYIKSGIDKKYSDTLLIHVVSPKVVTLESELNNDRVRETYMKCEVMLPNNIRFAQFTGTEEFNIMLQSSFIDTADKSLLLQVTGLIKEKDVRETGDDGISQAVTVKTGIAKIEDVFVPNPVVLAPYRTFPEIAQPESKFIFRMQTGPTAALFEADGGAWRNEAMGRIKAWLEEQLAEFKYIKIIS